MTQAQMWSVMDQERQALLDRIRFHESSAGRFEEDDGASIVGVTQRHIDYVKARLEQIDSRIASFVMADA